MESLYTKPLFKKALIQQFSSGRFYGQALKKQVLIKTNKNLRPNFNSTLIYLPPSFHVGHSYQKRFHSGPVCNVWRVAVGWCSNRPWADEHMITCSVSILCSASYDILENQLTVSWLALFLIFFVLLRFKTFQRNYEGLWNFVWFNKYTDHCVLQFRQVCLPYSF